MEELQDKYVRFDWAIKTLAPSEGKLWCIRRFPHRVLGEKVTILEITGE